MDYEQKFKESLSFLKDLKPYMSDYCREKLEEFFTELKESEDERIRKDIVVIKQEIEKEIGNIKRFIYHPSLAGHAKRDMTVVYETLNKLLQFINSLPEESGCEKKDYCERYEKLTQSDTFKSSYCDKSLGKEESTDEANCTIKSDDLEEAAKHYLYGAILYDDVYVGNPTEEDCIRCFKAGAEWQKRKDKETIELAEDHAMLAGMNKMKEEMMKDAVEAEVFTDYNINFGYGLLTANIDLDEQHLKEGDRVKIIIVKTEQQ